MRDRYSGEQSSELGNRLRTLISTMTLINGYCRKIEGVLENETRSCSMDFGGITPEYVYQMLGCKYSIDEIQDALSLCLKEYYER